MTLYALLSPLASLLSSTLISCLSPLPAPLVYPCPSSVHTTSCGVCACCVCARVCVCVCVMCVCVARVCVCMCVLCAVYMCVCFPSVLGDHNGPGRGASPGGGHHCVSVRRESPHGDYTAGPAAAGDGIETLPCLALPQSLCYRLMLCLWRCSGRRRLKPRSRCTSASRAGGHFSSSAVCCVSTVLTACFLSAFRSLTKLRCSARRCKAAIFTVNGAAVATRSNKNGYQVIGRLLLSRRIAIPFLLLSTAECADHWHRLAPQVIDRAWSTGDTSRRRDCHFAAPPPLPA